MTRFGFLTSIVWASCSIGIAAAEDAAIKHSFLATGGETYILGEDGKKEWSHPLPSRDGWVLPNGNVLLAIGKCKKYPGGGVEEVARDGKVVFVYKGTQGEVNSVQKVGEVYVITEAGPNPRLLEINAKGETVTEFALACQKQNVHMQTRMARKLPDGNYLCPHLLDFAVKEYDREGKVVSTIATDTRGREIHDWPFTAIRLENGNTLIGCTHGNSVIEVDGDGKMVWEVTDQDLGSGIIRDACGVQRLPNGNTVVASYAGGKGVKLFEVTREKEIVWTYKDGKRHGIHHFQILTTNGQTIEGIPLK